MGNKEERQHSGEIRKFCNMVTHFLPPFLSFQMELKKKTKPEFMVDVVLRNYEIMPLVLMLLVRRTVNTNSRLEEKHFSSIQYGVLNNYYRVG